MGFDSVEFLKRGARVTAIDLTESAVRIARQHFEVAGLKPEEVRVGNALELPFPDETFDAVWSNGVLHATGDTARAIAEVRRVLKPGGRAMISHFYRRPSWMWLVHRLGREPIEAHEEDPPVNEFYTDDDDPRACSGDSASWRRAREHHRALPVAKRGLKAALYHAVFRPTLQPASRTPGAALGLQAVGRRDQGSRLVRCASRSCCAHSTRAAAFGSTAPTLLKRLLDAGAGHEYVLLYRSAAHLGRFGARGNVEERVLPSRSKALWDQVIVPRACRRVTCRRHPAPEIHRAAAQCNPGGHGAARRGLVSSAGSAVLRASGPAVHARLHAAVPAPGSRHHLGIAPDNGRFRADLPAAAGARADRVLRPGAALSAGPTIQACSRKYGAATACRSVHTHPVQARRRRAQEHARNPRRLRAVARQRAAQAGRRRQGLRAISRGLRDSRFGLGPRRRLSGLAGPG